MGFNPLGMIVGAATGFLTGGPVGAAIGGAAGASGTSNLTSTVGNIGNAASSGWQSGILALQDAQNELSERISIPRETFLDGWQRGA